MFTKSIALKANREAAWIPTVRRSVKSQGPVQRKAGPVQRQASAKGGQRLCPDSDGAAAYYTEPLHNGVLLVFVLLS